ncbi:hypothetical protein BJ165DRAFT_1613591 [Panaeolus papilionaceus]|nr:hypothetical protein BJ165DRAFT_1613591 [Panaeolus papilionaceus]
MSVSGPTASTSQILIKSSPLRTQAQPLPLSNIQNGPINFLHHTSPCSIATTSTQGFREGDAPNTRRWSRAFDQAQQPSTPIYGNYHVTTVAPQSERLHEAYSTPHDNHVATEKTKSGREANTILQDGSSLVELTPVGIDATHGRRKTEAVPPLRQTISRHATMADKGSPSSILSPASSANVTNQTHSTIHGELPPVEATTTFQTEEVYRLHVSLQHDFHELLTLPLWDPTLVEVGAIGFLSKPAGQFVTLFNSMAPDKCDKMDIKALSPLDITIGVDKSDTRTLFHKVYDLILGSRSFNKYLTKVSTRVSSRRHVFRLKAGKEAAHMHAEITEHHYFEDLRGPKKWFQDNVDQILAVYASHPEVRKETLMLVTGVLRTPRYGLFVSHGHPEGRVQFRVYPNPGHRQPWGVFATTKGGGKSGPRYPASESAEDVPFDCHSKVWRVGDPSWNAILLARLQFKPDAVEPTLQ